MLMRIRKNMHWLGLYSGGDSEVNCGPDDQTSSVRA